MSDPFLAEIKMVSWNFAPRGWAFCNGQLLLINQNQALFSLLGTTYGGDGRVNFALPNLIARTPIERGNNIPLGQRSGADSVTLSISELPAHSHTPRANSAPADVGNAANNYWSAAGAFGPPAGGSMSPAAISNAGGGQPHNNWSPYLVLNFIIALQGIFPSQN